MAQDSASVTGRLLRLPRVQAALKGLLLLGMGIFLFTRITSGTLNYYISQRFDWLTVAAVVCLMVVGVSYRYLLQESGQESAGADGADGDRHHDYNQSHHHRHRGRDHSHTLGWTGFLLISLPILLGLLVPPKPLGVAALQNREISAGGLDSVLPAAARSTQVRESSERTILDWVLAFHQGERPAETDTADVVGFVYLDSATEKAQFTLARFVVGCCAADAMAVGLPVSLGAGLSSEEAVEEGQWVRVVGRFGASTGIELPVLVAEQLEVVAEPNQPYLYP